MHQSICTAQHWIVIKSPVKANGFFLEISHVLWLFLVFKCKRAEVSRENSGLNLKKKAKYPRTLRSSLTTTRRERKVTGDSKEGNLLLSHRHSGILTMNANAWVAWMRAMNDREIIRNYIKMVIPLQVVIYEMDRSVHQGKRNGNLGNGENR